ncbi:hypothetical protein DMO16_19910 [Fictibacillus sp. S7]|nr:hypothetical protein DMO16_19910 [Fictibacillus sp. S7]
MRDSYGKSGTDEALAPLPQELATRTVGVYAGKAQRPPEESEHPGTDINSHKYKHGYLFIKSYID